MWLDVVDLRDFYASGLGQMVRRLLRRRLRDIWPDVRGQRVLGSGFATPYLLPFRDEAERVVAVMPAGQGVLSWPQDGRGLVALTEDETLPFADRSFDRILVAHALEHCEHPRQLLRELWRVLADGGRILVVIPNRQGLWARLESTPFASGQPYSASQLGRLLRDTMFAPLGVHHALFAPPTPWRIVRAWAVAVERLGIRWCPGLSGVLLVEAGKQIYAASLQETRAVRRGYLQLPQGLRRNLENSGERTGAPPASASSRQKMPQDLSPAAPVVPPQ